MSGQLVFENHSLSREVFDDRCRRRAAVLQAKRVSPDDTVAILMRNDSAYLEMIEACRFIGARYVALNWHGSKTETEHILEDSNSCVLIGHSDLLQEFAGTEITLLAIPTPAGIAASYGVSVEIAPGLEDFDQLLTTILPVTGAAEKTRGLFAYTSGSTGRPKGIQRLSSPNAPDRYGMYQDLAANFLFLKPGDKFFVAAPMYHSAPNTLTLSALAGDGVDIIIAAQFNAEQFLAAVQEQGITHAYIVPIMMVRLLKLPQAVRDKYDVSSLRYTVSTGSPCPVDVKAAMIEWFGPIFNESYGASELGFMTLVSSREALLKPGSVGRARPGTEIKIFNDERVEMAVGEAGSIYIRSPLAASFSYTNAEGSLEDQHLSGFATVGDIGYVDDEGYLFISDRKKEMIISGGANIFPSEIEAELIQMPGVLDCAVFGAPDAEFGEMIVAAVVLEAGQSTDITQLKTFLEPRLARFKIPRKLDVHDSLPREDSGKIFKKHLRAPYWENQGRSI